MKLQPILMLLLYVNAAQPTPVRLPSTRLTLAPQQQPHHRLAPTPHDKEVARLLAIVG